MIRQAKVVPGLLTLLAAAALAAPAPRAGKTADEQIRAAVAETVKSGKHIILDFSADWCFDCHVLNEQMHSPGLAPLIARNYVVVHIDVGRFDKNLDVAARYGVPLRQGIPALAVLDEHGKLLYAQAQGEFQDARHLQPETVRAFFEKWKPQR